MTGAARGAAAALALLAGACGAQKFPTVARQPSPPPDEGEWARVRDRFTRSEKLYDLFAARAFASAVYQAPEVREARVARTAEWLAVPFAERERMLAQERDEAGRWDDFVVSLFTPDRADNDLDAKRSIWTVTLVVPGEGELEPQRVEALPPDATLTTLYPRVGHFDVVYRVRFARWPTPLAGKPFTLRLSSARGRIEFQY